MDEVYVVEHSYEVGEDGDFHERKLIGVFSSEKKAKEVIEEYKKLPGFRGYPKECFHAKKYKIDMKHWEKGFLNN